MFDKNYTYMEVVEPKTTWILQLSYEVTTFNTTWNQFVEYFQYNIKYGLDGLCAKPDQDSKLYSKIDA